MLSRRILRIKAFKAVYSYAEDTSAQTGDILSQLEESCESTRDLYLFLLSIAGPLTREARSRIESARSKYNPTEEEIHPNTKFIDNSLAPLLMEDPDFSKIIKKKKFSWEQYDVLLRHLWESVRDSGYYREYISREERSLKEDASLFADIFAAELTDNPELEAILEDMSIYWNDDVDYAVNLCVKTFEALGNGSRWSLPELYAGRDGKASEKPFVSGIVSTALRHFSDYYDAVAGITPKWDKNRICTTDLALIVTGLAEAATFPDMSPKIIINEYVEISKFYSTPESRSFVNGILDKLINKQQ